MPLFIFSVYLLWIFFSVFTVHIHLQQAADSVAGSLAQSSYLAASWEHSAQDAESKHRLEQMSDDGVSMNKLLSDAAWKTYAKEQVISLAGRELLDDSCIASGAGGISVLKSSWNQQGDLDLRLDYRIQIPVLLGFKWKIALTQHSLRRSWTGSQSRQSGESDVDFAEEMVYITQSGSVYHKDIRCYHLNLTIREVAYAGVDSQRNSKGGKYYPCEKCAVAVQIGARVFVAKEGNRYHTSRDCSGLKRTVTSVPISQAGRRPCSNCGK